MVSDSWVLLCEQATEQNNPIKIVVLNNFLIKNDLIEKIFFSCTIKSIDSFAFGIIRNQCAIDKTIRYPFFPYRSLCYFI